MLNAVLDAGMKRNVNKIATSTLLCDGRQVEIILVMTLALMTIWHLFGKGRRILKKLTSRGETRPPLYN